MRLAYLITFRCYGTWLHGDERGSVREGQNSFGDPLLEANAAQHRFNQRTMNSVAQDLDSARQKCIEYTIEEVADHRGWVLHALNVRSNHVHIVIGADAPPEKVMNDCKAYATRRLREQNLLPKTARIWAEHGSTRYLWCCQSFENACDYVLNRQDQERKEPEA